MRMENLSTLEKDNSSLISMANKWLFVYVKSEPVFILYIKYSMYSILQI